MKKRPHKGHYRVVMGIVSIALLFGLSSALLTVSERQLPPEFPVAAER